MIDGIHIWHAALDEAGWPGPQQLPGEERERAERFLRPQAARRWVASRWALRRVLGEYLGVAPAAVELEVGEHGKPRLLDDNGLEFNLSHSNGLALVAVTEGCAVGVDVELIEPGRDLASLAERALSPEDAGAVRTAAPPQRPAVFYAAWTRHEAFLKCLGTGLGAKTNRRFTSEGQNRRLALEEGSVTVTELDIAPRYAAAVAVTRAHVGPVDSRSLRAG